MCHTDTPGPHLLRAVRAARCGPQGRNDGPPGLRGVAGAEPYTNPALSGRAVMQAARLHNENIEIQGKQWQSVAVR